MRVLTHFTKSLNGSSRLLLSATRDMAVLSPPGMMRASQRASSASFRTSRKHQLLTDWCLDSRDFAACLSSWRCSLKAPWSASTPTVICPNEAMSGDEQAGKGLSGASLSSDVSEQERRSKSEFIFKL